MYFWIVRLSTRMPSLHDDDGLLPCRQQSGGQEEAKSVAQTQARLGGAAAEHVDLVAEGGVFDDELASRAAAEVGDDLKRFNAVPKRGELGPEPAGDGEDTPGDGGDCHGEVGPRFRYPGQDRLQGLSTRFPSRTRKVASMGARAE